MRDFLQRILKWKLRILARLTLWRYRPRIVAVTGSVGKTSTKRAIAAVLKMKYHVRAASGNFNNEFGLPLAILGKWKEVGGIWFWLKVLFSGMYRVLVRHDYPQILVLEYGIDRPGDMRYLLSIARPDAGVFTAVGDIPVHVEFFSGPEAVAREKGRLIESLSPGGVAILNADDAVVSQFENRTRARVITYGFGKGADMRIMNFRAREGGLMDEGGEGAPGGIVFKLEYAGNLVSFELHGVFGRAQAYAAAAAVCVGIGFDVGLTAAAEGLRSYRPAEGRMTIRRGIKDSVILNDCYNASPLSMHEALHTLHDLTGKRKIAVLGDMLELGTYTEDAHAAVGRLTAKCADVLLVIGPRAKFIAEAARSGGLSRSRIQSFDEAEKVIEPLLDIIKSGDVVLVKGSRAIGLERVVEGIAIRA